MSYKDRSGLDFEIAAIARATKKKARSKIKYIERKGELWFFYAEKMGYATLKSLGIIPKDIVGRGNDAIKDYARQHVKKEIEKQKAEYWKREKFEKDPNFPVTTEYRGIILEGKIILAEDGFLEVKLEKPYHGQRSTHYGMASAMSGRYIFTGHKKFSEDAYESAQGLLIQIYKEEKYREKNRSLIDLVDSLND